MRERRLKLTVMQHYSEYFNAEQGERDRFVYSCSTDVYLNPQARKIKEKSMMAHCESVKIGLKSYRLM